MRSSFGDSRIHRCLLALALTASILFVAASEPRNDWPSFRGSHASGVSDGQGLPLEWDAESGRSVRWKVGIPGLAHSSPIVWDGRVYVTTAVSGQPGATFRPGLYGDGDASSDRSLQEWRVYALDAQSGEVIWKTTAHKGEPRTKRHIKATYANATPATDGRYLVAMFGGEGLFTFDMQGKLLWKKDLGRLDMGAYNLRSYEWGPASSPIIYRDLVIVQCDTQDESFLLAANIQTGDTVWRTVRDELPSWGTPTIFPGPRRDELISNASNFIRGYDPLTGNELWRLGGSSKITAPTPIFTKDLIVVASGRRPERPLFAIRPGASGEITLANGQSSNRWVAWSKAGRGSYMPTPLIYGEHLYVLANHGVLDCYVLQTGEDVYRQRIPHQGAGFSASPVAADGRLYLSGEDGDVFVIRVGGEFEILATNSIGEPLMATPAIAGGMMFIRGQHHLFGIGE